MTLAEVVVALAIAGMMVASLVGGYTYSTVSAEKARLSLAANTRALERLEDTHAAIWNVSGWPTVDQLEPTNFPPKEVIIHELYHHHPGLAFAPIAPHSRGLRLGISRWQILRLVHEHGGNLARTRLSP